MATTKIFMSDVHIGAGRWGDEIQKRTNYTHNWDWLSVEEKQNFSKFLKYLPEKYPLNTEVVLLGDIFDNWIFPHDIKPPTMTELIETDENADVVAAIQRLSNEMKVFYVPGNHDMHATKDVMMRFFPNIRYCPEQYHSERLIAEHGHRYALFNAPARFSNNVAGLPLGYFISRMEATRKAKWNQGGRNYKTYVDDFLEVFGKATLSQCVFEAVMEETGLTKSTEFVYRDFADDVQTVKASDIMSSYEDLYEDWKHNIVSKPRAVLAELDRLEPIADRLCKHGKFKVCIMGHSHKFDVDVDRVFVNDRIYANAGYWCGSQCTFVEVNKVGGKYAVALKQWNRDGTVKNLMPIKKV